MAEKQPIKTPLELSGLDTDDVGADRASIIGDYQRNLSLIAGYDGNYLRPAVVDRHGYLVTRPNGFDRIKDEANGTAPTLLRFDPGFDGPAHFWVIYSSECVPLLSFEDSGGNRIFRFVPDPIITHDGTNKLFGSYARIWGSANKVYHQSDLDGSGSVRILAYQFDLR